MAETCCFQYAARINHTVEYLILLLSSASFVLSIWIIYGLNTFISPDTGLGRILFVQETSNSVATFFICLNTNVISIRNLRKIALTLLDYKTAKPVIMHSHTHKHTCSFWVAKRLSNSSVTFLNKFSIIWVKIVICFSKDDQ